MTNQPKCPVCNWTSRVEYLRRTKTFKCVHCGTEFNPDGTVIKTPNMEAWTQEEDEMPYTPID